MSIGILGTKIGMTQLFTKEQTYIPVTILKCGPCYITEIKNIDTHGYNAIQIGYLELIKKQRQIKLTHNLKEIKYKKFYFKKEFKVNDISKYEINQKIDVNTFVENTYINATSISIGKGFSGNIKRNHFTRGPMSHGSKHHRLQGSIGSGTTPGRVFPGKKMSGHLGVIKTTIKNLKIVNINKEKNLIIIKGSIPGKKGNLVILNNKI